MNFSTISFGVFSIEFIGIAYALSFFVLAWLWYKEIGRQNFSVDYFVHHFWKWFFGGIILGRIFSVLTHPDVFSEYGIAGLFAFWEGGISSIGALIGFLGFMYLDFKSTDFQILRWLDTLAIPLVISVFIMDIGFFLTGAIYGIPTSLFWGISYETFGVELITPVHPVTLYALIFHIGLYMWIRKNKNRLKERFGVLFCQSLWWLFVIQFLIGFLRADPDLYLLGLIRLQQILTLIVIVLLTLYIKKIKVTHSKSY